MHNEAFCQMLLTDIVNIGRSRNGLLDLEYRIFLMQNILLLVTVSKNLTRLLQTENISTRGNNFMSSICPKTFEMLFFSMGWIIDFFCIVKFSFLSLSPIPRFEPPDKRFYEEEEKNEQSLMEDEQLALHLLGVAWQILSNSAAARSCWEIYIEKS